MAHVHIPTTVLAAAGLVALFVALIGLLVIGRRSRKMVARAVRRGHDQLRTVLEQMPFGVLVVDGQSTAVRLSNAEADRLFGHKIEAAPVWDQRADMGVLDPQGAVADRESYALHQALTEKRRIGPKLQLYRRGDGVEVMLEVSAAPILDQHEEVESIVVAFQDVTERLRTEDALRRSAAVEDSVAQFRLIADSTPVLLWISDLGGVRRFVNQAYVDFLGLPYQEAIDFDWRRALHPEDLGRIVKEQIAGEASLEPFHLEARYQRGDGEVRWIHSLSKPRWDETGVHAGFVGVAYDVTDAKRAEADLLRINELLEERVEAALREKAEAEAALVHAQRLEAVGRLTGGVAHDFNNLLTVVIGSLDLMLKHPEDESRQKRLGEAALSAARRGERLTQQLLAFSRRQTLKPETLDLDAMIREIEPILRQAVGAALDFKISSGAEGGAARVDPAQFEAALLNLVVNAVDATPAGGRIGIETGRLQAGADVSPDLEPGDYVRVRVCDTGEGMSAPTLAQAFEPFFTTKELGKGTGLGLSQVYGFARQSGGLATVESTPGAGTTVSLYLPAVVMPAEVETAADAVPEREAAGPLDVLLVEDDAEVATIVETMLSDLGHHVTRAEAAAPALHLIESDAPFDLMLTDVVMPGGINGVQLALKATQIRPALRVLLSSGYARDALDETLAEARWPLLRKPYTKAELDEGLRAAATDTI
jgi:PAS domain S-box-containing protein